MTEVESKVNGWSRFKAGLEKLGFLVTKPVLLKASWGEHCAPHNFVLFTRLAGTRSSYTLQCTKWNRLWKDKCWNKFTNTCIRQNDLNKIKILRNIDIPLVSSLLTLTKFHTFSQYFIVEFGEVLPAASTDK